MAIKRLTADALKRLDERLGRTRWHYESDDGPRLRDILESKSKARREATYALPDAAASSNRHGDGGTAGFTTVPDEHNAPGSPPLPDFLTSDIMRDLWSEVVADFGPSANMQKLAVEFVIRWGEHLNCMGIPPWLFAVLTGDTGTDDVEDAEEDSESEQDSEAESLAALQEQPDEFQPSHEPEVHGSDAADDLSASVVADESQLDLSPGKHPSSEATRNGGPNNAASKPAPGQHVQEARQGVADGSAEVAQATGPIETNTTQVQPVAPVQLPWLQRRQAAARTAERTAPTHLRAQHAPPVPTHSALPKEFRHYYFIANEGAMVHALDRSVVDCRTFELAHASDLPHGKLASLLSHPAFADHVCLGRRYAPGKPQTFHESGALHYNSYQPPEWPAEPGDVEPFLSIAEQLAGGDQEIKAIVLMTLSHVVQHPGERLRYIPSFISPSSTNTEVLREITTTVVGPKNVAMPDPTTFTGAHSDWLADVMLVMPTPVGSSRSFQERMSSLLTSPQLLVNPKGRAHVRVTNQVSQFAFVPDLGVFGHFPDPERLAPVPLSPVSLDPHEVDRFRRWFHAEGKKAVLDFLQSIDLVAAGFSAVKPPPRARMSVQFANLTRPPVENYLREALAAGSPPMDRDLVSINQVVEHLLREVGMRVTWAEVRDALVALQAVHLGQKRVGGRRPNLWAVRRTDFWSSQSERAIAEHLAGRRED